MERNSIFAKTSKGKTAINNKDRSLSIDARRILIMVNGARTTGELLDQFSGFTDVATHLQGLLDDDLIVDIRSAGGKAAALPADPSQHVPVTPLDDALRQRLEREIIEFMGPMGILICEEAWPRVTTLDEALEVLSSQLDTPEQARKFRLSVLKAG
ncbi:hypothetical protein [Ectothiorhodospira lacustris]|uniref:hypothetical protein n=1 Tax=Ectothiorhodospira lacustris TaxID=2899127 RepID=UPI001EE8AFE6|nr:hypothetical protein [Ectothiorhodospira lacustris]MCG5501697.1 hypothetical protein [Ectothiorhodospira lacustris]MCG5510247.1 hypothetical protein [Ectothiorhodospira lacustris]MCG5521886.1 hypothetical protein [Ectothiorhodospira lacustris]